MLKEKKLDLSEGSEVIRVAGIVRTEDIAPNGTVFSRRLANAQISYVGSGELDSANRVLGNFFTCSNFGHFDMR